MDGPNLYAYVKENPWTSFDPEGLQTMLFQAPVWLDPVVRFGVEGGGRFVGESGGRFIPEYAVPRSGGIVPRTGLVPEVITPRPTPAPTAVPKPQVAPAPQPGQAPAPKIEPTPAISPVPGTSPTKTDKQTQEENKQQSNTVWRGGNNNNTTFTPRPGTPDVDPNHPDRGLSTYRDPRRAAGEGGKAYEIDLNKLPLDTFDTAERPDGHVSIRPKTQAELEDWAKSRPTAKEKPHPMTEKVRKAQTGRKYP